MTDLHLLPHRGVRLGFAPTRAAAADGAQRAAARTAYHRDLVRPFGLELARDTATLEHSGPSYGAMGRALLAAAVPPDEPVDLLVLAYAVPDLEPGRATATYLSHVCPGRPLAFAISDQGTAAAFTGLRLINEYARSGDIRRGVLLVVEQPTLPYDPGVPVTLPAGHSGVALVLDTRDAGPALQLTSVSVEPGVAAADLESPATTHPDETAVLLGAGFSPAETRPYTGAWWRLVGLLSTEGMPERVLLADVEPVSRSLCLAEFRART